MTGAFFFSGQYGSTAQYADWIRSATGLPVFHVNDSSADPSAYDFLILGSSVIAFKLTIRKWLTANWSNIEDKPIVLFSVSGAGAGSKLDGWLAGCLPEGVSAKMNHVALRGRLDPKKVSFVHKVMLRIGAWRNKDPQAKKEELEGFDYMDESSIEPVLALTRQFQSSEDKHELKESIGLS